MADASDHDETTDWPTLSLKRERVNPHPRKKMTKNTIKLCVAEWAPLPVGDAGAPLAPPCT